MVLLTDTSCNTNHLVPGHLSSGHAWAWNSYCACIALVVRYDKEYSAVFGREGDRLVQGGGVKISQAAVIAIMVKMV